MPGGLGGGAGSGGPHLTRSVLVGLLLLQAVLVAFVTGSFHLQLGDGADVRQPSAPQNPHPGPLAPEPLGYSRPPRWVTQQSTDDGGALRLHEVFDSSRGVPRVRWSAGGPDDLVIPDVKPEGWTPVAPLQFECPALHWFNKPQHAAFGEGGNLVVAPDANTDFWQESGSGALTVDTGHFLHLEARQHRGHTLSISARFALRARYAGDKVGLLVRRGSGAWASVALQAGEERISVATVVTNNGHSDWADAGCPLGGGCAEVSLRLSVRDDLVVMEANPTQDEEEGAWAAVRRATLHDAGEEEGKKVISIGAFAAAPGYKGMEAVTSYMSLSIWNKTRNGPHIARFRRRAV